MEACDKGLFHVEQAAGRGAGPLRLFPVQRRSSRCDRNVRPGGLALHRQAVYSVVKKFGKTTTAALFGVWHLLFDDTESSREVIPWPATSIRRPSR